MGAEQSNHVHGRHLGTALIFNHVNFPGRETYLRKRDGSDKDVARLKSSFQRIGLDVVSLRSDMTTNQVKFTIDYHARLADHSADSCLIIVVLSHGEAGGKIFTHDSHYFTNDIWDSLNHKESTLHDITKILIFQACRGHSDEALVHRQGPESSSNEPSYKLPKLPHDAKFVMAYSTVEHRTSKRHVVDGTWYIETLCEEIDKLETPVQLFEFMTRVTRGVVARRHGKVGQTPVFISQLNQPNLFVPAPQELHRYILYDGICNDSSSQIESDSSGRMLPPPTQTHYMTRNKRGQAMIFYNGNSYKNSALKLEKYLKILNFNIKLVEFSNYRNNLLSKLEEVRKDEKISNTSCLMIAVFASLEYSTENDSLLEKCCINIGKASYPLEYTWCPFMASKCSDLLNTPKLFFFIDTEYDGLQDDAPREQTEIPEPYRCPDNSVTEHSDFLLVVGYGGEFLREFCTELRECVKNENDIHTVVTTAMYNSTEYANRQKFGRIPHFESTLRFKLQFQAHDEIENTEENDNLSTTVAQKVRVLTFVVRVLLGNLQDIRKPNNQSIIEENRRLKSELSYCKRKLQEAEQEKCNRKLIIENYPLVEGENLQDILCKICDKIEVQTYYLSEDVLSIKRVKNNTENHRYPPKIMIKFLSKEIRDKIIQSSKNHKLKGHDLGLQSSLRIYINPCLTQENYDLFTYANKVLKNQQESNYNYVWYSNKGKILARKMSNSEPIIIKSKEMVNNLAKEM